MFVRGDNLFLAENPNDLTYKIVQNFIFYNEVEINVSVMVEIKMA